MLMTMTISLYTYRIVINALGVEDYGIYGVVGGVVSMFSFINASLAGATARFLTYELGREDLQQLNKTFCMAFYEHLIISGLILIICESFGLWFLNTKLIIPENRIFAANCVFQLSLFSMVISITQVPYNASIISHEKMNVYAYFGIAEVIFKLIIVYLLYLFKSDKLIFYAILVFLVHLIIAMSYRLYCIYHFPECKIKKIWDLTLFRRMLTFSGWDLYGNLSITARTQGVNMLLNMFFGPIVNASASIATTVQGVVMSFASKVSVAVKPQIIKYYAKGEFDKMVNLISNAIRLNYLILMFLTVPLILELPYVLHLWIGIIPEYTVIFCILTLIFNFHANISQTLVTGIHATGKIKRPSIINGTLYLLVVPITYIAFKLHKDAWIPFLFNTFAVIIGMISNAYTLHLYIKVFSLKRFFLKDFLPSLMVFGISMTFCIIPKLFFPESFFRLIFTTLCSSIVLSILGYLLLIPKSLSIKIRNKFISVLCKKI